MQKLLAAIIFGIGLVWASAASADPHYYVVQGTAPGSDGYVELRTEAFGRGTVKCKVPAGNYLKRDHEQNWSRWINVRWEIPTPSDITNPTGGTSYYGHSADSRGTNEWEYIDADGAWCPLWARGRLWADKSDPDLRVLNGHPNDLYGVTYPVNTWGGLSHISSPGIWEWDGIPVYRTPREFLKARDARRPIGNPVCLLSTNDHILWTRPYRNWGVSAVHASKCSGYTDRGVLER